MSQCHTREINLLRRETVKVKPRIQFPCWKRIKMLPEVISEEIQENKLETLEVSDRKLTQTTSEFVFLMRLEVKGHSQ